MPRFGYVLLKTTPLWLGGLVYIFFYLALFTEPHVPQVPFQRNGAILFWQGDAIYTVEADGQNLTRISPAYRADQRHVAVSPACHGLVEVPCVVVIGHVLYHISSQTSDPLPVNPATEWLNTPVVWSPDGQHIAYVVADKVDGQRILLVYNLRHNLLYTIDTQIDQSRAPAWSAACAAGLDAPGCRLAYSVKRQPTDTGDVVMTHEFATDAHHRYVLPTGISQVLVWMADDDLYVGGPRGWFRAADLEPLLPQTTTMAAGIAISPDGRQVAYTSFDSGEANEQGLNLTNLNRHTDRLVVPFSPDVPGDKQFNKNPFWSPAGDGLVTFNQGRLVYYDLQTEQARVWYTTYGMDVLSSYAFAPNRTALAFVEGQWLDNPEKPQQRLAVVDQSGQVTTLIDRSKTPIVIFAWLSTAFSDPPKFYRVDDVL